MEVGERPDECKFVDGALRVEAHNEFGVDEDEGEDDEENAKGLIVGDTIGLKTAGPTIPGEFGLGRMVDGVLGV